jgi:hypothetical protein
MSEMHLSQQTIESLVAESIRFLCQHTIESLVAESIRFLSSPCSNAPLLSSSAFESHSDRSLGCVAMRAVLVELSYRLCCRGEEIVEVSSFLPLLNRSFVFVFVVIVIISTSAISERCVISGRFHLTGTSSSFSSLMREGISLSSTTRGGIVDKDIRAM